LQVISNVIDRRLPPAAAIGEPRLHHQWLPDEVVVERGFPPELLRALADRGHIVREGLPPTSANSIMVAPYGLIGAADHRTRGALAMGH
jgi:gamma-glutamyltranspeptidase/glutathione hydrolase